MIVAAVKEREELLIREVNVVAGDASLSGTLTIPRPVHGVVLFAHGSGSSRHSPRNQYVAEVLNQAGLATLLIDLLTPREESADATTGEYRFNIELLAQRLHGATDWLSQYPQTQ